MADDKNIIIQLIIEGADKAAEAFKKVSDAARENLGKLKAEADKLNIGEKIEQGFEKAGEAIGGKIGETTAALGRAGAALGGVAGPVALGIGAIGAAAAAAGVSMFEWSKRSVEQTEQLRRLSGVTGETTESITGLQDAVAAGGVDPKQFEQSYFRMAGTVEQTWERVVKASKDAKDKQVSDFISVGNAQTHLFDAQQAFRQKMEQLGRPSGIPAATDLQIRQNEERKATLELQAAQQTARLAEKRQREDQLNDINNVAAAVKRVQQGEETAAEAGKKANLEAGKVVEGLVTNAASPEAVERLKGLSGGIQEIATQTPKVKEVFYNLADFIKNAKNPTLEFQVATQLLGQQMAAQLIPTLREGSKAIKEQEDHYEKLGLTIHDSAMKPAEEFQKQVVRFNNDASIVSKQTGLAFAPAFTESMKSLNDFFEQNAKTATDWAKTVGEKTKPVIKEITDGVIGLTAALSGANVTPGSGAEQWAKYFEPLKKGIQDAKAEITDLYNFIDREAKRRTPGGAWALTPEAGLKALQDRYGGPQPKVPDIIAAGADDPRKALADNTAATRENTAAISRDVDIRRSTGGPGSITTTEKNARRVESLKPGEVMESATANVFGGRAKFIAAPASGTTADLSGVPGAFSAAPISPADVPLPQPRPPEAPEAGVGQQGQGPEQEIEQAGQQAAQGIENAGQSLEQSLATSLAPDQIVAPIQQSSQGIGEAAQQIADGLSSGAGQLAGAIAQLIAAFAQGAGSSRGQEGGGFAEGGIIDGPGTGTSDSIHIAASKGEGITTADATAHYGGKGFIDAINQKRLRFSLGGIIDGPIAPVQRFAGGGVVESNQSSGGRPFILNLPEGRVNVGTISESGERHLARIATDRAVRSGGNKPSHYRSS